MIIQFSDDIQNQKAIDALMTEQQHTVFSFYELEKTDQSDTTLILLDLSANGTTQGLIEPGILAEQLNEHNFLNHLETIKVVISDIDPNMPIHLYASELCRSIMRLKPNSSISIMYVGKSEDIMSLIEPPSTPQGSWTVYSLPFDRMELTRTPVAEIEDKIQQYRKDIEMETDHFALFKSKMPTIWFKGDNKTLWAESNVIQPDVIRKEFRHEALVEEKKSYG